MKVTDTDLPIVVEPARNKIRDLPIMAGGSPIMAGDRRVGGGGGG